MSHLQHYLGQERELEELTAQNHFYPAKYLNINLFSRITSFTSHLHFSDNVVTLIHMNKQDDHFPQPSNQNLVQFCTASKRKIIREKVHNATISQSFYKFTSVF